LKRNNIIENIREELLRAEESMKAAELLFQSNLLNDAVSRLYYFALFCVRALLLTEGIEARSHEGALRLLSLHFVKPKIISTEIAHIFSRLMKYRGEADYNPSYVFTADDFLLFKSEAEKMTSAIKAYIKEREYIH